MGIILYLAHPARVSHRAPCPMCAELCSCWGPLKVQGTLRAVPLESRPQKGLCSPRQQGAISSAPGQCPAEIPSPWEDPKPMEGGSQAGISPAPHPTGTHEHPASPPWP